MARGVWGLELRVGEARSGVGFAVGIASNLIFRSPLSDSRFRSLPPAKHLVLTEDEV